MSKINKDDPQIKRIKRDLQKREFPVVVELKTSVLYAEDAYEVVRYYVNRIAKENLPCANYEKCPRLLNLAAGPGTAGQNFFWLCMHEGLYYAVSIAYQKSILYIGDAALSPFAEMLAVPRVEVCVKTQNFFGQPIGLYGCFSFRDFVLTPELLIIKSSCVYNIKTRPWNNPVEIRRPECLIGYDMCGRKGHWEESVYWRMYNISKKIWTGEKILVQYAPEDEPPSYQDMIESMRTSLHGD